MVLAVVGVAVVLALLVFGIGSFGEDDDAALGDPDTSTTIDLSDPEITAPPSEEPLDPSVPVMPSLPGLVPGADPEAQARPLAEVLPEIIDFVEVTRGQEFLTDPVVEAVPDEEFEQLLAEAQTGGEEELTAASVTDIALGLIPPGTDLVEATRSAGAVSVLGFYEPESGELYVKGETVTPFVQSVIAHELTHALDDQIFDLSLLDELIERPDESAFGYLALVEGTASYVGNAFTAQLSPEDRAAYDTEQLELGFEQLPALIDIPPAFLIEQQIPYASGELFVQALVDDGGTAGIDAAYGTPPDTSEQILDPQAYFADEGAVEVTPPEPEGTVAEEGAFGAADLRLLEIAGDPTALIDPDLGSFEPYPGFGGGRFVSWTADGESCVRLEVVGDDAAGSAAISDSLDAWAAAVGGAEVSSRVGGTGVAVVTVFRCA